MRPVLGGKTWGERDDIGLRFVLAGRPAPGKPIADAIGAGIVGRGSEANIAELPGQIGQQARRFGNGLFGIERVCQSTFGGGAPA